MKKDNKNSFELIFEQKDLMNKNQMNVLKGGAPSGCVDINIGFIACTNLCIGKAQYPE